MISETVCIATCKSILDGRVPGVKQGVTEARERFGMGPIHLRPTIPKLDAAANLQ